MLCTPRNSAIFTPVPFAKFHMSRTQIEDYSSTHSLSILSFGEESKTCRKISLNAGYNILFSDVFLNQRTNFLTNITMLKRKTAIWQARKLIYLVCLSSESTCTEVFYYRWNPTVTLIWLFIHYYFMYLFKNFRWKSFRIVSLMKRLAGLSSPRAWFLKTTSSSHLQPFAKAL